MMDHVVSNHPGYLLYIVVAYLIQHRVAILHTDHRDQLRLFFSQSSAVSIDRIIKTANHMLAHTIETQDPCCLLDVAVPLPQGQYPVFSKYPAFVVDYHVNERERIRREEMDFLSQRVLALQLEQQTHRLKNEVCG